jgi:hypothetical protein
MHRIVNLSVAIALFAGSAGGAWAACAPRDLGGEWQFYNTWWEDGLGLNWSRCLIEMDKTGAVLAVTECEDSDVAGVFDPDVFAGQMSIAPDCVITGFVQFGETSSEEEIAVTHATMNTRKGMIVGVGEDVDGPPTYWTFSMIAK